MNRYDNKFIDEFKKTLLSNKKINVKVKPNSRKNDIIDSNNDIFTIAIKEKAENNKANIELMKYVKKISGVNVKIIGKTSKNKVLVVC